MAWNHNIQYHSWVLHQIPRGCQRALDVGCGRGELAAKLAHYAQDVVALDLDPQDLPPNITFMQADILKHPLAAGSFDFISVVATLHHLPLQLSLLRFSQLLKPGGVLAVVGLYRGSTLQDFASAALAAPASRAMRLILGATEVGAAMQEPKETLAEIRAACNAEMPGGKFTRRLFFRYSFVWRKPRS